MLNSYLVDSSSVNSRIDPTTIQQLMDHDDYPGETAARPESFYVKLGNDSITPKVGFYPTPDAAYTLYYHYVKRPPSIVDGFDPVIPEAYHRTIIQHALYSALWKDVKTDVADRWKSEYESDVARMKGEINSFLGKMPKRMQPYRKEHADRVRFTRDD